MSRPRSTVQIRWSNFSELPCRWFPPTTFFLVITGVMSAIKEWTYVMLLTGGGPGGQTSVFGMLAYQYAFPTSGLTQDLGVASSITVVMLALAILMRSSTGNSKTVGFITTEVERRASL